MTISICEVTCPACSGGSAATSGTTIPNLAVDSVMLRSNCPPSASEVQDILKSIELGNSQIQSLADDIQRVKNTLTALERRQEEVKNYVACQRSFLSPIRRIPPEIMGRIFLALRDISEQICFGDDALENIEIWTVLRVCRFWRDVALSHSELWMRFNIVRQAFSRPNQSDVESALQKTMHLTRDCITYSRSRPLHFVFHANEDFMDAAELLATESFRWTSVAFNNLPVLRALECNGTGPLPHLLSLELDGLGREWVVQSQPLELFQQAPNLTKLTLYEFDQPHVRFKLPWYQITHLSTCNLHQFLPILNLMPSLVEMQSVEDACYADEIEDRILLPNLKRLRVTSNSPRTSQIFDAINTPQLNSISLFSKRGFSRLYAAAVVQMLKSSGCSLQSLSVTDYAVDSILPILYEARELEKLTVTNLRHPSELLSGMKGVLPRLRELALRKCAPEMALIPSLIRLLQDDDSYLRQNVGHSLEKISIGFASPPEPEFLRSWTKSADQLVLYLPGIVELLDSLNHAYPLGLTPPSSSDR